MTMVDGRPARRIGEYGDDAPTVALLLPGRPGRHARPDRADVTSGRGPVVPAPRGPWPGPAPVGPGHPALWGVAPAGLAMPLSPQGRRLQDRLRDAIGPDALEQIPGPVRRHPLIAAGALAGFVVLALALIVAAAFPSAITVEGSFRHTDTSSVLTPGASCYTGLYTAGTRVDVTDDTGAVVATGTLDEGIAMVDSDSTYGRLGYATECAFAFTVDDVPTGSGSYGIEIAGVPNRLSFSEQELRAGPGLHNGS